VRADLSTTCAKRDFVIDIPIVEGQRTEGLQILASITSQIPILTERRGARSLHPISVHSNAMRRSISLKFASSLRRS
jgi:hypothetical protein